MRISVALLAVPLFFFCQPESPPYSGPPDYVQSTAGQEIPPNKEKGNSVEPTRLSKDRIAEEVEAVLRKGVFLRVTTTFTMEMVDGSNTPLPYGKGPYIIRSMFAKDHVRTSMFELSECDVRVETRLFDFAFYDGKAYERLPSMGSYPPYEYVEPNINQRYTHGASDIVLPFDNACVMGGHLMSWVGAPVDTARRYSDRAGSMRWKIDQGVQEADAVVDGRKCYVFKQQIRALPLLSHQVFVDTETFCVLRWVTLHDGLKKDRVTSFKFSDAVPEGTIWSIQAETPPTK